MNEASISFGGQTYPGVYRGIVVDTNDPENRGRYRVCVWGVNNPPTKLKGLQPEQDVYWKDVPNLDDPDNPSASQTVAVDSPFNYLPWAETISHGAKGAGDRFAYRVGDLVWIQFENADHTLPVIVGGWTSYQCGVNDVPLEWVGEPPYTDNIWVRADRAGNWLTLSDYESENWAVLGSGAARITAWSHDESVRVDTFHTFGVESNAVSIRTGTAFLTGQDVYLTAYGRPAPDNYKIKSGDNNIPPASPPSSPALNEYQGENDHRISDEGDDLPNPDVDAGDQAIVALISNHDAIVHGDDEVWIGQYLERVTDGGVIQPEWQQARVTFIASKFIVIGGASYRTNSWFQSVDSDTSDAKLDTETVEVEAATNVSIRATGSSGDETGNLTGTSQTTTIAGLYSAEVAEIYGDEYIVVGQVIAPDGDEQEPDNASYSAHQTAHYYNQANEIFVGITPNDPDCGGQIGNINPTDSSGVDTIATDSLRMWANTCITIATSREGKTPGLGYCAARSIGCGNADITVAAAGTLYLHGYQGVKVNGQSLILHVRVYNYSSDTKLLQVTGDPCPVSDTIWTTIATLTKKQVVTAVACSGTNVTGTYDDVFTF